MFHVKFIKQRFTFLFFLLHCNQHKITGENKMKKYFYSIKSTRTSEGRYVFSDIYVADNSDTPEEVMHGILREASGRTEYKYNENDFIFIAFNRID